MSPWVTRLTTQTTDIHMPPGTTEALLSRALPPPVRHSDMKLSVKKWKVKTVKSRLSYPKESPAETSAKPRMPPTRLAGTSALRSRGTFARSTVPASSIQTMKAKAITPGNVEVMLNPLCCESLPGAARQA